MSSFTLRKRYNKLYISHLLIHPLNTINCNTYHGFLSVGIIELPPLPVLVYMIGLSWGVWGDKYGHISFAPLSHLRCAGLVYRRKACWIPAGDAISGLGMHAPTHPRLPRHPIRLLVSLYPTVPFDLHQLSGVLPRHPLQLRPYPQSGTGVGGLRGGVAGPGVVSGGCGFPTASVLACM